MVLDLSVLGTKTWDQFNLINANMVKRFDFTDRNFTLRSLNEEVATVEVDAQSKAAVITVVGFGVSYIVAQYTDPETGYEYSAFLRIYGKPLPENRVDKDGAVVYDWDSEASDTYPMVGAGENFSVVLRDNGTVWTFGANYDTSTDDSAAGDGRIGKGHADRISYTTPQQIIGAGMVGAVDQSGEALVNMVVTKIAVGANFTLALTREHQLVVWGNNAYGQLGTGNTSNIYSPTVVDLSSYLRAGDGPVVDIAAGENYSLLLTQNGQVYGMGSNADGKLVMGESSMKSASTTPVRIVLPSNARAVDIAADVSTSHVLTWTGDVVSWGTGTAGQFGTANYSLQGPNYAEIGAVVRATADGKDYETVPPTDVRGKAITSASRFIALGAGAGSVAAIDVDGQVAVWGNNDKGQLAARVTQAAYTPAQYEHQTEVDETTSQETTRLVKTADGFYTVGETYPESVMFATFANGYNTTYTDAVDNGGVYETVTRPSVALQTTMGQTGYVLYTKLGEATVSEDASAVDSEGLVPYTLLAAGSNSHGQLGVESGPGKLAGTTQGMAARCWPTTTTTARSTPGATTPPGSWATAPTATTPPPSWSSRTAAAPIWTSAGCWWTTTPPCPTTPPPSSSTSQRRRPPSPRRSWVPI